MLLSELLSRVAVGTIEGSTEIDIAGIAYDSRQVGKNFLFAAMPGQRADGAAFVADAVARGASAVLSEKMPAKHNGVTNIVVENSRAALADVAAAFYRFPAAHLKMAGVTGTNGKTTTAFLLKHICDAALLRCGLIGTVRYEIGERRLPAPRTTPESLDLQDLLYQIRSAGCKAAVMEVSSHALTQDRVRGVEYDVAIFTNLTQDHLDYHKSMDAYFEAKARLFTGLQQQRKKGRAVINIDDRYGARLLGMLPRDSVAITYGVGQKADFRASNLRMDFSGASYQLDYREKSYLVRLPLIGRFNMYNSLAAVASASLLGIDVRSAVLSLANAPSVPGRLEPVPGRKQFKVFVDYAHTDDALRNVIRTLRDVSPNRLIVVFGCGGNRDRAKRPLMAAAVEELADWAIVTSDNPRNEAPEDIIADIETGFSHHNYEVIVDRRVAINKAIAMADVRDVVLIAGKGHETYQEFADHVAPFDDVAVAREASEARPVEMRG